MADAMVELIEEAAIPVCMVGLLYALPNTQLTRRLTKEGRLHPPPEFASSRADQCTLGLNFDTLRPRKEILTDYRDILQKAYEPEAFAGRLRKLAKLLDNSNRERTRARPAIPGANSRARWQRIVERLPGARDQFRQILVQCATHESELTAHHRDADGVLSASRPVLAPCDRADRVTGSPSLR